MWSYLTLVVFAVVSLTTAKPGVVTPLAYSTPSLYTPSGSSQVEVRNNYNSASGYSTSMGYASPLMARLASPLAAYAYTSVPVARLSPSLVPMGYNAPIARYESPFVGASYPSAYSVLSGTPYASSYTPFSSSYASPYTTAYASPYQIGSSGPSPVLV